MHVYKTNFLISDRITHHWLEDQVNGTLKYIYFLFTIVLCVHHFYYMQVPWLSHYTHVCSSIIVANCMYSCIALVLSIFYSSYNSNGWFSMFILLLFFTILFHFSFICPCLSTCSLVHCSFSKLRQCLFCIEDNTFFFKGGKSVKSQS